VGLKDVADWRNLAAAFERASRGKRGRTDVVAFAADLEGRLERLRRQILAGDIEVGRTRRFLIHDPKPRVIHAPPFEERVLHHALMAPIAPVLDRSLVADTYACREGKGALSAVLRAQHHLRRQPWYAQIDIRGYFASIDHAVLLDLLARKFKNRELLPLVARVVGAHEDAPGRGLPIGALTSQHFANAYLASADRHLLETCQVGGFVRYMDDLVWWGRDRIEVRDALASVSRHIEGSLRLEVKRPVLVRRSSEGLNFCGFRVRANRLLLSGRRRRRYALHRRRWEEAWLAGRIDDTELQAGYAAALGITAHADAAGWRRAELARRPLDPALVAL
jgi:hypothetical protein